MAVRDIEAFVRERAAKFDSNLDITPGSPFDTQVLQPLVRRLGIDPFSVDLSTFITERLRQAFPDMATDEGDALADLLIKPTTLLWDPLVREVGRVQRNLSFKDPSTLTVDEAEALGANLFSDRRTGSFARGSARLHFKQPQSVTVSPVNFCTSKAGLHFFPTETQSIRTDEMLINLASDGTYYFDINAIAEAAGDKYNIGPTELVSIANIESAVKVTNLRKFQDGKDEDTAEEYVDRARGELTEQSLVTLRGISSKLTRAFPEIRRLNVTGFNDPEMQRDILRGGGAGEILAAGTGGLTVDDGDNQAASRRFSSTDPIDFTLLIGPVTVIPEGFIVTLVEGIDSLVAPPVVDFHVTRVIDSTTLEFEEQELGIGRVDRRWSLRRQELTLSSIPGGIIFPNGPQGTVVVRGNEVHVGGCTDIFLRSTDFDEATLVLETVTDDVVELSGVEAIPTSDIIGTGTFGFTLEDFVLGTDYAINDNTFRLLERAGRQGLTLQIVSGPDSSNLGVYRVIAVEQLNGQAAKLQILPTPASLLAGNYRWRLFDQINVDLLNPKETRVSPSDLITAQNFDIVRSGDALNFSDFGVSQDDVLEILDGPDAGRYTITEAPLAPGFDRLRIDTKLKNTASNISYTVYRPNPAGGVLLPLIRIKKVELLDSSNQPLGTVIPYAKTVDVQSRAFQNPARGIKHTISDAQLGIISTSTVSATFGNPGGETLEILVLQRDGSTLVAPLITLSTAATLPTAISLINASLGTLGYPNTAFAFDSTRFAIRPTSAGLIVNGGSGVPYLFGSLEPRTTADIRSASVIATVGDWDSLNPAVDFVSGLDVVQVVDGHQLGYYPIPFSGPISTGRVFNGNGLLDSTALIIRDTTLAPDEQTRQFAPEEHVRLELGARSLGSVRCFFLEPTSVEFDQNSFFYLDTSAGRVRFLPDPTLDTQIIPPLPSDSKSNDGSSTASDSLFTAVSQDFLRSGISTGDRLTIDYVPVAGTVVLTDPVPNLVGKTLVFSIDDSPNLTLTFIRDDVSLGATEVSRDGVIAQINAKAGSNIAKLTSGDVIEFETDALLSIRHVGTANAVILGNVDGSSGPVSFSGSIDVTNESPFAGGYTILSVSQTVLTIIGTFPVSGLSTVHPGPLLVRQGFRISRPGTQRTSSTQMSEQSAEAGLYFCDVELVSEGSGDLWNIDAGKQLFVDDYRSDGYFLTTDDSNLSFSIAEKPRLVISKSVLEQGVDDDPNNATQIVGQNLQITYERSQLVADVQAFVTSEIERVGVQSALSRHLIPHFVRFDLNYVGGSTEEIVVQDIEDYIRDLFPADALEASDLQKIVSDRGATSIVNPLSLIAVVHNVDRSVQASRSQNALTTGRLAAFIPDVLSIKRSTV